MNDKNEQSQTEWTIMVYIAADDLLANFAIESLKQLKAAAGDRVVVAAQLDVDGPVARQGIKRYIFDNQSSAGTTIDKDIVKLLDPKTNMVDPRNLTAFIDSVCSEERCKAKRYALVLWGHGPELLAESAPPIGQPLKNPNPDGSTKLYLTPRQLGQALKFANIRHFDNQKLQILALDACSSSLAEIAAEVHSYAEVLVASQEDVPDMSFPYDRLLDLFRTTSASPNQVQEICKTSVNKYRENYQDYIFGANTGTSKVSLSAIDLTGFETTMAPPIKALATALMSATANSTLAPRILAARKFSHGFVAGLFVDIVSFCENMLNQLDSSPVKNSQLQTACEGIVASFRSNGKPTCVIANAALEPTQCHGLSIYFPFLTDQDVEDMDVNLLQGGNVLTKGGDILSKGGDILSKGGDILAKGGDILSKMRRQRISEVEADFAGSELFKQTNWYGFIRDGWSRLLAQLLQPEELDIRYSAQQCAVNLLNAIVNRPLDGPKDSTYQAIAPDNAAHVQQPPPGKKGNGVSEQTDALGI